MPICMAIRIDDRSSEIVLRHDRVPRYGPRNTTHQLVAQRIQSDRVDCADRARCERKRRPYFCDGLPLTRTSPGAGIGTGASGDQSQNVLGLATGELFPG